jgi:CheB methylesterase
MAKRRRKRKKSDQAIPLGSQARIGASAGGQFLDPTHEGMLVELLQRSTRMPVREAADEVVVEANHVYVIPPTPWGT